MALVAGPDEKGDGAGSAVRPMGGDFASSLDEEIDVAGGEWQEGEEFAGAVGRTMFDTPASKDNTITVLMPPDQIRLVPSQSLVRIKSRPLDRDGDGRQYLGAVVAGPFAEPDGLRADAPIVVTTTVRGTTFMPRYHGRVQVGVLGEEVDSVLQPPRFRPLPNSPVFAVSEDETGVLLGLGGDVDLGLAVGFENMRVQLPSDRKSVLPRHLGILGTTGGGKSTTVSGLVGQFAKAGIATVLIDTEGEYTHMDEPTEDSHMLSLLRRNGRQAEGVGDLSVFHLVGHATTADDRTTRHEFRLDFSSLSPYAAAEIMGLSEAQEDRFFKTYDVARLVLRDLGIFPDTSDSQQKEKDERLALELDEFQTGYPQLALSFLIDIAGFFRARVAGTADSFRPFNIALKSDRARAIVQPRIASVQTASESSWNALVGKLFRLQRTKVFDNRSAEAIPFAELLHPGRISIVDLSDTDSTVINNLVISNVLLGLQRAQEDAYAEAQKQNHQPTPLMVVVEEAHEFLSRTRIAKMQKVFEQVARIARRGRKRWSGLVFVTQLPQHLPDEVLSLMNNYILHKMTDASVISHLKRSIGGIDEGLWERLPNLAPGQAIVSMTNMARPLLVAINPTPCKLRMID